jgi:cell division protein ZapA (FtsZ GTPase activity inhibitor)
MTPLGKNRIKLNICGCECVISSEDSENYIRSVGDEVQKAINGTMDKNGRISITMAAIISALSYCDDSHKNSAAAENLRSQIKDYLEDSSKARMEAEEAKRETERLKREIQTLRSRLSGDDAADTAADKRTPIAPGISTGHPQTGNFSRVQPKEGTSDPEGFMSFFEKKSDEP